MVSDLIIGECVCFCYCSIVEITRVLVWKHCAEVISYCVEVRIMVCWRTGVLCRTNATQQRYQQQYVNNCFHIRSPDFSANSACSAVSSGAVFRNTILLFDTMHKNVRKTLHENRGR